MTPYPAFLRARLGNYVIVQRRRKQPMFDQRGNEQNQVLPREYKAAERDYRALYGDPYDQVRAAPAGSVGAVGGRLGRSAGCSDSG